MLDDEAPVLSVAPASAVESGGPLTFEATLAFAIGEPTSVEYSTLDGSGDAGARAGEDYTAASGTLTFPAGTTTGRIVVAAVDDDHDEEEEETFQLRLRNARNATLDGNVLTLEVPGTVQDDDVPVVRASWRGLPEYNLAETALHGLVPRVVLDREPEREVRVRVEVTPHGGAGATDYEARSKTWWSYGTLSREAELPFPTPPVVVVFQSDWDNNYSYHLSAVDDDFDDDDCKWLELKIVPESPRVTGDGVVQVRLPDDDGETVDCNYGSPGGGGGASPGGGGGGGSPRPPEPEPEPPPLFPTSDGGVHGRGRDLRRGPLPRAHRRGVAVRGHDHGRGAVPPLGVRRREDVAVRRAGARLGPRRVSTR